MSLLFEKNKNILFRIVYYEKFYFVHLNYTNVKYGKNSTYFLLIPG